jgi:hypothetical protein
MNGFTDHLQVVTTNNYYSTADFHTTNHSTLNLLSVLSLVFTIRFLATDLTQSQCTSNTTVTTAHVQSSCLH